MDVSGDVADLMVKESIQLTEASIKIWRHCCGSLPRITRSWSAKPV